ncbi:MAG TPA: DUF5723 family protein, partial [Flavobacteriales bacterium]|nr:DUF5723 family protein [Flavobacteriales bacterium]
MRFLLLPILVLVSAPLFAQERFGISSSNYAGADATYLNPARSAGQWPYADVRLVGFDLYAWNSLVAWGNRDQKLVGELRNGMSGTANGELVMRGNMRGDNCAFVQAELLGPAFSLVLGKGTIGAGVRTRSFTSATGVSDAFGNFIYNGFNYLPQRGIRYNDDHTRLLTATWTEVAVNYGRILRAEGFGILSAGVNAHYNIGHMGGALQFSTLDYTVLDSGQLDLHQVTTSYGVAMPAFNAGSGWGGDIGFTYERTIDEADGYMPHHASGSCDPRKYRYRIGL